MQEVKTRSGQTFIIYDKINEILPVFRNTVDSIKKCHNEGRHTDEYAEIKYKDIHAPQFFINGIGVTGKMIEDELSESGEIDRISILDANGNGHTFGRGLRGIYSVHNPDITYSPDKDTKNTVWSVM